MYACYQHKQGATCREGGQSGKSHSTCSTAKDCDFSTEGEFA